MMGHRVRLGSAENDFTGKRRNPCYGHKAGGATIYVKRLSTHKERRRNARELLALAHQVPIGSDWA